VSARRVMNELGEPYASNLEMVCFHTVSKGTLGECGMRGGCATWSCTLLVFGAAPLSTQ